MGQNTDLWGGKALVAAERIVQGVGLAAGGGHLSELLGIGLKISGSCL